MAEGDIVFNLWRLHAADEFLFFELEFLLGDEPILAQVIQLGQQGGHIA